MTEVLCSIFCENTPDSKIWSENKKLLLLHIFRVKLASEVKLGAQAETVLV